MHYIWHDIRTGKGKYKNGRWRSDIFKEYTSDQLH